MKPVLGLELTATPIVETSKESVKFKNVIFDYPLAKAMADGFVKEPAVVTQKNFDPKQFTPEQLEQIKLEDGIRLHENTKVELETYALQTAQRIVKPFILIIARDTTHASQLIEHIKSDKFFEGRYKDKVIQVDSSKTGAEEDEMVERLLKVESPDEPTEIVIHVNMLKEGWDVTNLYTIVPLRAANARVLIEQSIGRGLRLPYGRRTGVNSVDRLNIVAHDRFQEIIEEAGRSDSAIQLQQVILDPGTDFQKMSTVLMLPNLTVLVGAAISQNLSSQMTTPPLTTAFATEAEQRVAQATVNVIRRFENLPSSAHLQKADVQKKIAEQVAEAVAPYQQILPGVKESLDISALVAKTTDLVINQTIDIPRISLVPRGQMSTGFNHFMLDCSSINYQPVEHDLLIQVLRTKEQETLSSGGFSQQELRMEDYLVRGLVDFDDISYDEHADLLYDLAGQMVKHLRSYLTEEATKNVLISYQKPIADAIHTQMQVHVWEEKVEHDVVVSKGFQPLKESACSKKGDEPVYDFRNSVEDKVRIAQMFFGGFKHCLFSTQKFQSDSERKLAVILDREATKWFKPAKGQFQIYYKMGIEQPEYVPDFVAETDKCIYMMEPKARNEMAGTDVQAKKDVAEKWCAHASRHSTDNGGKPWKYVLIPHDAIMENMSIAGLVSQYGT